MSRFKCGLKLTKGAMMDELEISDSESSDGKENSDTGAGDCESDAQSEDEFAAPKPERMTNRPGENGETQEIKPRDSKNEMEDDNAGSEDIQYPVTCSLCNRVLFNLAAVNQHMTSKGHLKKEAEDLKSRKEPLSQDKIQKLKERNERKKKRKLEKQRAEREAKGHVWGEHKKPIKKANPATSSPLTGNERASSKKFHNVTSGKVPLKSEVKPEAKESKNETGEAIQNQKKRKTASKSYEFEDSKPARKAKGVKMRKGTLVD